MRKINFKRQDELVQASLVFSMLHPVEFKKELGVNFSHEEMDRARNFFANRSLPRKNGERRPKRKRV